MKHVLITGGSGFIGSHLCELFLSRGYAVTAIDNFVTGRKENLSTILGQPHFDLIEHDVTLPFDEQDFKLFKKHGLAGVLHFACPASPIDFERIPFEILAVDSIGTMNTVSLALKHKARFMVASTSEIYGDPLVHPQTEDYFGNVNTIGPRACYDETKRFAEAYVSSAIRGVENGPRKQAPLNGAIVRIFNTYGPRMRPDDGRIVPELCIQGLKGEPLTVHGQGQQTRSFCYVSDLIEGIFRLFESKITVPVNIGNPVEQTILQFAKTVQEATGGRSTLRYLPARPDDPRKRCPDITRARELLKWEPKVSFAEGIRESIDYFRTQL
ncbi:MAG TPA: NAD-dependent dehydratase [Bdellovibrionales bacterium]|nr:MAG: NAD-dependent dehydratase [Bdellovibrionales bacterium GWB1_52_6]OFZ05072.1 MAG: NAD-dependent dehydratase [Bdellovibrionales bacterium GWA1_52_35]OFZ34154.1 MAG: NAD-dependent dehydratase [Bdellovibrionales bacterium GWC1_52_8]HAR44525.1 NAD-dependent dehydratase [Bdellovibrionales bacterium]HCM41308.1 NAD-dependent dehydratase [Bdellovibrionales bacterium]